MMKIDDDRDKDRDDDQPDPDCLVSSSLLVEQSSIADRNSALGVGRWALGVETIGIFPNAL